MPSVLEASTNSNYSRSEWGSLSIQDRIRAMNQQLDATPPSLVVQTASLPDNPPLNPPSLEAPSESDANNLSSSAAPKSPTFRKRSSVVDIWRQREAGGGNVSAANQTDDSNFKDRETAVPSLVPTTRPLAEEEKKDYDDEENTKPKSRSDMWGKQVPSSSRPQELDFSNETMFDSNTTSSTSNTPNPTTRASESSDLIILQPKYTEPKSNSSKVIAKWAYHSLNDTLEKATMPTAPEKIQEPKAEPENTAAQPKRSRALDLWMKQSCPATSNNTPQPETNFEARNRNSKRSVSVSSGTSDSIDAAIGNAKRASANSRSKKGIVTNKDEARVEKVGRIAAAANSNKSLAVDNKKTGKSSEFFSVAKDKESTKNKKGGRSNDVASSDSFFAWSTDEVEVTNRMRTDLRVIAKPDPPAGFSPTRKWKTLELSGPSKPRSVDGWNVEARADAQPKTRAAPSKRFATPPPLLPNAFKEQQAWTASPDPSAKFSPFQAQHSPLQTNFGHINTDSPTPKEAKKFWEIKVFHSMSQDKGFPLDWPTLDNYKRKKEDATNPDSKEEERRGGTSPIPPSKSQKDRRQFHAKGDSVRWQGDLHANDFAWQDNGPAWQADAPLWQDDAKVWQGAWPDEAPVRSDDGEPWPTSEAPVLSDDFRISQESKAWNDDMKGKASYGAKTWPSGATAKVDAGNGEIVQLVEKARSLAPVKPLEHSWIAISKKSEVTKRSDKSDHIQEDSSHEESSHAFIGNISRACEESTSPAIYKRPIEVSPFKPISPKVANLKRHVENQAVNADSQGSDDRSMTHLRSALTLPSLHPSISNDDQQDRRGHESFSDKVPSRQIGVAENSESHIMDCIPNDAAQSFRENKLLFNVNPDNKLPSEPSQPESRQSESVHYGVIASSGKIIRRRLFTERRRWVSSTVTSTTKKTSEGMFVKLSNSSASMESTSFVRSATNSISKHRLQAQENEIGSNEVERNGCQDSPSTLASPCSTRDASPKREARNLSAADEDCQQTIERRSKRAIPSPVRLRNQPQSLPVAPNPKSSERVSMNSSEQPSHLPTMFSDQRANSPLRVSKALTQPSTIKKLPQEKSSANVSDASNLPLLTPTEPSIIRSASSPLRMARLAFQTSKVHSTGSKLSETTPDSSKARIQSFESKQRSIPDTAQSPKSPSKPTPNPSNATNAVSSQLRQMSNQNVSNRAASSRTATSPFKAVSGLSRPAINLSLVVLPTPASVEETKPGNGVKSPCDKKTMYPGINELHYTPPEASTRNQMHHKGILQIDHQPQNIERGDRSASQSSNAEEKRPGVSCATKGKDDTVSGQHRQHRGKVSSVVLDGPGKSNSTSLASFKTMVSSPWRFGAPSIASTGGNEVKLKTNGTPERSKSVEPRSSSTPRRMGVSSITLPSSADRPVRFRRTLLKPDPRRFKAGFRGSDGATKGKEDALKSDHLKPKPKRQSDSKMNDSTKPSSSGNSLTRRTTTEVGTEKNVVRKSGLQERSKVEVQDPDDGDSWSFDELTADSSQVATSVEPNERHCKVPSDQGNETRKSYQDTCALADSSESSKTEAKIHAPSFTSENAVVLPETNAMDSSSQQTRKKSLSVEVLNSSYTKEATAVAPGKVENGARLRPAKIDTGVSAKTNSKPRESLRVQHKKRLETRYKMPLSPSTKSDAGASDTNLSIFSGASSAFSGWSTTSAASKGSQSALSSRAGKVLQGRRRQKVSQLVDRPSKGEVYDQSRAPFVAQEMKKRAARSTATSNVVADTPPPVEDSRPTLASLYNRTSRFIEEASQVTANVFADSGALSALRVHGLVSGSVLPSPRGTACTPLDVDQASIQAGSRTNSFGSETTESSVEEVQSNASSVPSWTSPDPRLIQTFCAVHTQRIPCKEPCDSVKRRSTVDSCEETASNVDAFQNAYQSINFTQLAHNLSETVGVKAIDLQKFANEFKDGLSRGIPPSKRRTTKRKLRVPRRRENNNDEEIAIEVEYIEDNSDASYDEDSDEDDEVQSSGDVGRQHAAPLKVDTSFPKDMLDGEIEPSMSPAGQPSHESGLHEAR